MPSSKLVWDPGHWRLRAEETRTVADQMTHEEARTIMRRIANDYDRLAKVAEEQLADQEKKRLAIDASTSASGGQVVSIISARSGRLVFARPRKGA
jgi:hypothetical protein